MKKMMIAAMLVLGASAAFAGDSDVLKAITKEKDYAKAVELVKSASDSWLIRARKLKPMTT